MTNAIEVSHLTKDYGTFKLDDVSFTVPGGSIMGLIGENGAGKSTTIKCILNLIRRDSGEVRVLGLDNIRDERAVKEQLGVVLDESTFHDTLRARDVAGILRRVYKNWDMALFDHYLQKFALPDGKAVKEYSRGMKMKLSIAAALASRPRLLILDEATGGLDPVVRNEILEEFLEFIQDEEHAILISSHITSDLERVADYVTYLHQGRVAISGAKDELLERHGRLVCTREQLERVDPAYIVGRRVGRFSCEALIRDREEFRFRWPELTVDPVTLEEIMVFTVKGDQK
jgi:ABC-2 type transport system ATP-binding protein